MVDQFGAHIGWGWIVGPIVIAAFVAWWIVLRRRP